MRSSFWRTVGFMIAGAIIGTLAGQLLSSQVGAFAHSVPVEWHPSADLGVIKYSISIVVRVNWMTLVGVIAGYFVSKRLK
jgi:ABC-type antimicrobial peptide transport system permease subunit